MALLLVFAGRTLFVWGTRVSNILSDGGGALALLVAVGLVVLALGVAVRAVTGRLAAAVPALVVATVVVWAVRVPGLLLHDHSAAFTVVHLTLAVVSVGLALAARRVPERVPA